MIELGKLTLLAEGAQARVYHYGDDKVLRVMRRPEDETLLKNEIAVIGALRDAGVLVPKTYEYMQIGDHPAAMSEKIKGISLMEYLNRHPLGVVQVGRWLGERHLQLAGAASEVTLQPGRERSRYIVGQSEWLDESRMDFVLSLIDGLPDGSDLCHGDFHPGNILRQGDQNYIIDWVGVYRGDLLSDAANTYLLMNNTPKPPGVGPVRYARMGMTGPLLSRGYMGALRKGRPMDMGVFSQWLVIKAAERTVYGLSGEKERLAAFIETCRDLHQKGVPPDRWYKRL